MVIEETPVDVLMSIHPRHAEQILSGLKQVEFRRKSPKRPVKHMIVYATSPIQRVVGFARVLTVVKGSLESLWSQFGSVGGITRAEFDAYFAGLDEGSVLVLSEATTLKVPLMADRIIPFAFIGASLAAAVSPLST
jgi:predicted transcriptional regulator